MLSRIAFFVSLLLLASCVSTRATPPTLPPPTLPRATGIPVTPKPSAPRATDLPTATVEILPTPENMSAMFRAANEELKNYKPPESNPQPLYDALAQGIGEFLAATANGDVSLEGQPALEQLNQALSEIENMPEDAQAHAAALHTGDDQGGSRDVVFVAIDRVMGLPIIALERLGATYEPLAPISFDGFETAEARNFYPTQVQTRDVTGDGARELIYMFEYPGGSGVTNEVTIARWLAQEKQAKTIFHANLINWAGEATYEIETTADASSIKLTFPWFGAFDAKLLAHPNATQAWEYDDAQDSFVRVSQTIQEPQTPRQALNAGEYAFRNGDWNTALAMYERVWNDANLQPEDFSESNADPKAFAKFCQALVLGLMGRAEDAKTLLSDAQKSGDALASVANIYAKNSTGQNGALRGWIAMANAGDLYRLVYDGKAGNLDFPFEAQEIYAQGGIVAAYLNTHNDAAKNPDELWNALTSLNFKPLQRAAVDLNGDGVNEFFVVTHEGGDSPNQSESLWFIYQRDNAWRVRALDIADTVQFQGDSALPQGRALQVKLPEDFAPNEIALTWDGSRILWLDAQTLAPRADNWPSVGGGVLDDDF